MRLVIDASVAVKWLFPDPRVEPDADRALAVLRAIRDRRAEVLQPRHWLLEVMAVTVRLAPQLQSTALNLFDALELDVERDKEVLALGATLAAELDHHLFDTLYHALALKRDAVLLTADKRYARKAYARGSLRLLDEPLPLPGLE